MLLNVLATETKENVSVYFFYCGSDFIGSIFDTENATIQCNKQRRWKQVVMTICSYQYLLRYNILEKEEVNDEEKYIAHELTEMSTNDTPYKHSIVITLALFIIIGRDKLRNGIKQLSILYKYLKSLCLSLFKCSVILTQT